MKIALLTGGDFKSYSLSLLQALVGKGIFVDFIGNDEMSTAEIIADKKVNFLNLRGDQSPSASIGQKITRVIKYYFKLVTYAYTTDAPIFHIQSFNKFILFDRTFLNAYYKLLGKRLVFTAHNIDAKQRDGGNNMLNRLSLRILYGLMDHIFVHTNAMKTQLVQEFSVSDHKITVHHHGILSTIPKSDLTKSAARATLQLDSHDKVLLFFGNIAPYKGLEFLLQAMALLKVHDDSFKLIIAGQVKDCQAYWENIEQIIEGLGLNKYLLKLIKFIPDEDVETLFVASDVLILPYKFIFQSGVPFLSYNFGLPVISTDAGSLSDIVVDGKTGMICRKEDPHDLADKIRKYFDCELYKNLEENRNSIIGYGKETFSWDGVGTKIHAVYEALLA